MSAFMGHRLNSPCRYGNSTNHICKIKCNKMRISDGRYTRDLRRLQLAWQLMEHGARNRTVEQWSGLTMYRVRILHRTYRGSGAGAAEARRGVAPHQVSYFFRSAKLKCEGAVLGGLLRLYEVLPESPSAGGPERLAGVARGERLCQAYAAFKGYCPDSSSTVEHAILLLTELVRGSEVRLSHCLQCRSLILQDCLALRGAECAYCSWKSHAGRWRLASYPGPKEAELSPPVESEPGQQSSLF
jgi:hypothetical protein